MSLGFGRGSQAQSFRAFIVSWRAGTSSITTCCSSGSSNRRCRLSSGSIGGFFVLDIGRSTITACRRHATRFRRFSHGTTSISLCPTTSKPRRTLMPTSCFGCIKPKPQSQRLIQPLWKAYDTAISYPSSNPTNPQPFKLLGGHFKLPGQGKILAWI